MYERILVPLDGSALAESVLVRARPILTRPGTEVVVLRAIDLVPAMFPTQPLADLNSASMLATIQDEVEQYVERQVETLRADGVAAHGIVRTGSAGSTILDVAASGDVSLVAMSTHGRSGLARWVLGSVAEKVLRHAQVPILALHSFGASGVEFEGKPMSVQKILVPIDGSPISQRIAPHAIELARTFGASVEVFHAIESLTGETPVQTADVEVRAVRDEIARAGIAVEVVCRRGDAAGAIVDHAEGTGTDLVAMASHGRSGASRWLLGSVAEKVVRGTHLPVFLLPVR